MNTQMDHTSEIWINAKPKQPAILAIYGPKFSHLGFICPACGSVDVFMRWNNPKQLEGHCLDCSHKWKEQPMKSEPPKQITVAKWKGLDR